MSKEHDTAFPLSTSSTFLDEKGLSKRELIATMALQGLISGCYAGNNAGFTPYGNCVAAVEYADTLLLELEKEK